MTRLHDVPLGKMQELEKLLGAQGVSVEHVEYLLRNPEMIKAWARELEKITNIRLDDWSVPGMGLSAREKAFQGLYDKSVGIIEKPIPKDDLVNPYYELPVRRNYGDQLSLD